ncbi:MAG: tRNA(fMet)-specific endonuclease VapC [Candidatus Bathyarchaeota archaeon BA2]|nr:MAG: tRNA(fMet)-specific endonuclease VapC [Candidatus Bathyarchaeota archaeon BA2]
MKVVLDTYPLIVLLKNEPGAEDVQRILYKIERREIDGLISSLTLSEIFYILARYMNTEFAATVLKYIKINLDWASVSDEIAEKGGEFKFKYTKDKGLPLADAIIAATAFKEKATLISGEEHFKKIEEIKVKTPQEFLKV